MCIFYWNVFLRFHWNSRSEVLTNCSTDEHHHYERWLWPFSVSTYSLSAAQRHSGSWSAAPGRWCSARWGQIHVVLQSPPGSGSHAWTAKNSVPETQSSIHSGGYAQCNHDNKSYCCVTNMRVYLTLRPMRSSTSSRVLGLDLARRVLLLRCFLLAGGLSSGRRLT